MEVPSTNILLEDISDLYKIIQFNYMSENTLGLHSNYDTEDLTQQQLTK